MSEKTIMILMGILSVGFAGIIGFSIMTSDRMAPEISFPDTEITYTEGSDTASLLEGVSAIDDCNGDVSESVCIDSIVPNTKEGKATIVYAAYDFSNNVAKAKRSIAYVATDSQEESISEETTEEAGESVETEEITESEAETEEEDIVNPEAPVLTMEVNEFSIETGGPFTPKNRVQSVEDDVDSSDYLMNHLQVVGDYDIDTAGRYELDYYVIDSSGNESNHEPMTLIVEEAATQQRTTTTQQTNRTQNQTQTAQQPTEQPVQQPTQQPEQQPVQQPEQQPEAQQPETQQTEQQAE